MKRLEWLEARSPPAGVGSNSTQPSPGMNASTQEWASLARIRYCDDTSLNSPPENPFTTRDGMPRLRSITAIEDAKYSQCPWRRTKRKFAIGSCGVVLGSCKVYPKWDCR